MSTRLLIHKRTLAVVAGAALITAPFTFAGVASAAPGTIKIAEAGSPVTNANDPKVCHFVIRAFNFNGSSVSFAVNPEGDTNQPSPPFPASGTFAINADGFGESATLNLPDGQYKAFVQGVASPAAITNGGSKKKVFKVSCPGGGSGGNGGGGGGGGGNSGGNGNGDGGSNGNGKGDGDTKGEKKDRDDGPGAVGGVNTGGGGGR